VGISVRSDLETQPSSAHSWFHVLGVSRDVFRAGHFLHVLVERRVFTSKNVQVGARLWICGNLAMEDLVVHRSLTGAQLNGNLPHFLDHLHRQRACECEGEESEEGKDGEDKGRALHAERVEVERRVRKVVGSKAGGNLGETGLVGDPILQKHAG